MMKSNAICFGCQWGRREGALAVENWKEGRGGEQAERGGAVRRRDDSEVCASDSESLVTWLGCTNERAWEHDSSDMSKRNLTVCEPSCTNLGVRDANVG